MSDLSPSSRTRRVLGWAAVVLLAVVLVAIVFGGSAIVNAGEADDEAFVVAAGETRDETLIVTAPHVQIDGTVEGDVVAWARRVEISGKIRGNVIAFAEDVELSVEGVVDGTLHCVCRELRLRGEVERNAYALAQRAIVGNTGSIGRDLIAVTALTRVDGEIARDLHLRSKDATLAGEVGRDVRGDVSRLGASAQSNVGGDIDLRVHDPDAVRVEDGASVAGVMRIDELPVESRYGRPGWYLLQVFQLLAAFVVGLVLARVYPPLFTAPFGRARSVALDVGIGLLLLVVTPVVAVLALFTIIGLPLGLIALVAYVLALYLAGIVVGGRIGNAVVRRRPMGSALPLLVGLLILAVATALPYVGPIVAIVATVAGLAIMVRVIRERRRR